MMISIVIEMTMKMTGDGDDADNDIENDNNKSNRLVVKWYYHNSNGRDDNSETVIRTITITCVIAQ